jgi:hypothetical protein
LAAQDRRRPNPGEDEDAAAPTPAVRTATTRGFPDAMARHENSGPLDVVSLGIRSAIQDNTRLPTFFSGSPIAIHKVII